MWCLVVCDCSLVRLVEVRVWRARWWWGLLLVAVMLDMDCVAATVDLLC